MSFPSETFRTVNKQLMQQVPGIQNIGLLNGKMGVSIYFFYLARETGNNVHQEFAEKLLDEIYEKVSNNETSLDFENGLAGIAWGIEHLVQNRFVEANTDSILSNVDNKIYKHLIIAEELPVGPLIGVLGYMLYVTSRLKGKDLDNDIQRRSVSWSDLEQCVQQSRLAWT